MEIRVPGSQTSVTFGYEDRSLVAKHTAGVSVRSLWREELRVFPLVLWLSVYLQARNPEVA